MKGLSRLMGLLATDAAEAAAGVPVSGLQAVRLSGMDAYELVDRLARGPARAGAWNAYALQIYGDKLLAGGVNPDYVAADTFELAGQLFSLAGWWVQEAGRLAANPSDLAAARLRDPLPHFHTPLRSNEQLLGMRQALEELRAYVAYDLESLRLDESAALPLRQSLAAVDGALGRASGLWVERPPPELRGGIGDALSNGLGMVYALGRSLAEQA